MLVKPSVAFVIEAYFLFKEKLKKNIVNGEFVKMTISNLTLYLSVLNENIQLYPH